MNQDRGMKHMIQCHCILPQYKNRKEPFFHKFIAFSVIDENDKVIPKFMHCNNCGVVHNIVDLCKSEIVIGKEMSKSLMTKEDIRPGIPGNIAKILDTYECDLPLWEEVQFLYDKERWGTSVVLSRENLNGTVTGKLLVLLGGSRIKIEPFTRNETIEDNDSKIR